MTGTSPDPDTTARLLRGRLAAGPLELKVAGGSMRGVIESGSTVEVHAATRPYEGEIWAFTADDGRLFVHRVRHVTPDGVIGRGTGNPEDDDPVGHQRLVGRVMAATTDGRVRRFGSLDRMRAAVAFRIRAVLRPLRRPFG